MFSCRYTYTVLDRYENSAERVWACLSWPVRRGTRHRRRRREFSSRRQLIRTKCLTRTFRRTFLIVEV